MADIKKFLDQQGVEYLWKKLSLQDYPNNETLIAVINAIDENKADKTTTNSLQEAIDILNGTGEGSVKYTVADAVATIVAQAPEDFDTLKEIADWIAGDETGTLNLIERVGAAEEEIEDLKTKDVQADWFQTDETALDYIKNKPTIPSIDGLATEEYVNTQIASSLSSFNKITYSTVDLETGVSELAEGEVYLVYE